MKKLLFPMMMATTVVLPVTSYADVTLEAVGMQVVWKSLEKEFDGFKTYNSSEGTYVSLALRGGDKSIIGFDKDKSKMTISDGTNDLGGKFGMWDKISKDGKVMRIEVESEKLPASDTTTLKLTGKLDVTVASKTETKSTQPREFKKGDKVELMDNFKFVIDEIGKPKWEDAALLITFKWRKKVPELAAVRFYDKEGKLIESSEASSSWGGFQGNYTMTKSYKLKKKSDSLKIEMDLWMDAETISLPVDVTVGAGGAVETK